MTPEQVEELNALLQVPINRRLDANCIVYINNMIKQAKLELLNQMYAEDEITSTIYYTNKAILEEK